MECSKDHQRAAPRQQQQHHAVQQPVRRARAARSLHVEDRERGSVCKAQVVARSAVIEQRRRAGCSRNRGNGAQRSRSLRRSGQRRQHCAASAAAQTRMTRDKAAAAVACGATP